MVGYPTLRRTIACAGFLLALSPLSLFAAGTPAAGERLFTGATRFASGGPSCASCHDIAGLRFPRGGSLGPDLTGTWKKYGPERLEPVLTTLYFPTMVPVFSARPMTDTERADLAAFFQAAGSHPPATGTTGELAALAGGGVAVLLLAVRLAWPSRVGSVRADMMRSAGREEGRRR